MDGTNDVLLKQLVRQLKWLNFWVTFFGVLFLVTLALSGFMLYKMAVYVHNTEQKITSLQTKTSQTLDVQKQACGNDSLAALLKQAGYC